MTPMLSLKIKKLGELDELDRITHAWIGINYSLTQAQKTLSSVMVRVADS